MKKRERSPSNKESRKQVAALPVRVSDEGDISVLLVSSRESKRWIIPKGWTTQKLSNHRAAAREAREEAGVTGKIGKKPIATFAYKKLLTGHSFLIEVDIYVLWVKKQLKHWLEEKERTRIWTSFEDATKLVREPGLKRVFADLAKEPQTLLEQSASKRGGRLI